MTTSGSTSAARSRSPSPRCARPATPRDPPSISSTTSSRLTGDTLFVDSVGRPDLAERTEEFAHNLYRSLHERVLTESDDTLVLPGHYSHHVPVHPNLPVGARLGDLRTSLDPLGLDEDAFVEWAATHVAERPPNYSEIIKANMGRSDLPQSTLEHLELGPNRCSV